MAFSAGNNGSQTGFGRRRFGGGHSVLAEMNVVPLVDVVLVLLIIFMLTAHVMEFGLEINVPQVKQVQENAENLPVISITRDGRLFLAEKMLNINDMANRVKREYPGQNAVYIVGDETAPYGIVINVVSTLNEAKLGIKLVAKPEDFGRNK
jgi:biopolymer transport protein ExbD